MYLTEEISMANRLSAEMGASLAKSAIFGNDTTEMLFNLMRVNSYIEIMERNQTEKIWVEATPQLLQGQKVPLSSLTKLNNTLYLDLSKAPCTEIDIDSCLSDEELCSIVECVKRLCYKN